MHLKKHYTFLLLFALIGLQAQEVKYGPAWKADFNGRSPYVIHEDDRSLYTAEVYDDEIYLQIFDKGRLSPNQQLILELEELYDLYDLDYELNTYAYFGGKMLVFLDVDQRKMDRARLMVAEFDLNNGRVLDTLEISSHQYNYSAEYVSHEIRFTPDESGFLLNTIVYDEGKETTEQLIQFFNDKLEVEASREYLFNGEGDKLPGPSIIDNEGTIYFFRSGELVMMDPFNDYEEFGEPIPTEDLAVNASLVNWAVDFNPRGNVVLTSLYLTTDAEDQPDANLPRRDRLQGDTQIEGVKYFEYDPVNQEFVADRLTLFDQSFIDDFRYDDDKFDKHDGEINQNFSYIELLFDEDNNAYMLGQPRRKVITRFNGGTSISKYYNEVMVLSFNPEGELRWNLRVPIRAEYFWGSGSFGSSSPDGVYFWSSPRNVDQHFGFYADVRDGKLQILYNDDPINRAGKSQDQELKNFRMLKKGHPVIQTIDLATGNRKGDQERKLAKPKMYMKPQLMYYSEMDDTYYYFLARKKMIQLCSVEL